MINAKQLVRYVIQPVLDKLEAEGEGSGWNTPDALSLVLETGMQESLLCHIDQLDSGEERPGPAYGLFQLEARTHRSIWNNWLRAKPGTSRVLRGLLAQKVGHGEVPDIDEIHGNLYYAAAMCRVYYRTIPTSLPDTREGRAAYWKRYYNTIHGRGTEKQYLASAKRLYMVYG